MYWYKIYSDTIQNSVSFCGAQSDIKNFMVILKLKINGKQLHGSWFIVFDYGNIFTSNNPLEIFI